MNIVKLNEKQFSNFKKFENCTVVPIIGAAGCRSEHHGNMVFWGGTELRPNNSDSESPTLYILGGNFTVNIKQKDGKMNFHFNPTKEQPNALWLDLSSFEEFHTEDKWSLLEGEAGYISETIYSGGGAHHQNVFVGIFENGCKLKNYRESYKNREGNETLTYVIKNLKLIETFED